MSVLLDAGVAIYVAMATALVVWLGVFIFVWRIDNATQALAKQVATQHDEGASAAPRARVEVKKEVSHE